MNSSKFLSLILLSITITILVSPIIFSLNMDEYIVDQQSNQGKDSYLTSNDLKIKSKSIINDELAINDVEIKNQAELSINLE
ncbi:MAG: hypothetical protein ACXACU_16145 [Candidatus Hodarchaeales archaeon]